MLLLGDFFFIANPMGFLGNRHKDFYELDDKRGLQVTKPGIYEHMHEVLEKINSRSLISEFYYAPYLWMENDGRGEDAIQPFIHNHERLHYPNVSLGAFVSIDA